MNKTGPQLQQHILGLMARGVDQPTSYLEFDELARAIFAFQFEANPVYRAYCMQQQRTPKTVRYWTEIPAVPTQAFKEFALTCFPVEQSVATFHTSGTTQSKPGNHHFLTLELYEAAIRPNFKSHFLPVDARLPMLVLTPSPEQAPHSSLAHMTGVVTKEFGSPESAFYIEGNDLLAEKLVRDLLELQWAHLPVFLLGTAFAFAHLFEHCEKNNLRFEMAEGSRAMETGGFKGRSREMSKKELHASFEKHLGIPSSCVVNEYGMTELSTQFYDWTIRTGQQTDRKAVAPWSRVQIIDPNTGREAAPSERGMIRVFDLANLWSVLCVQTEDLGVALDNGFEVLGRVADAEVRGCSLNAEALSLK
jgi:acyl-protein synthetase LuxE